MSVRASLAWTALWIALALGFGGALYAYEGQTAALDFLAGYLIEKSLSVDNLFVFLVIFGSLGIPAALQRRVLFWGITSAFALRAIMIFGGAALLERFEWLHYVFGAFLVVTAAKLFSERDAGPDPRAAPPDGGSARWLARLARRLFPVEERLDGSKFFTTGTGARAGRVVATPMFLALVVVEATDLVFAVDSIPAIFAVTRDPWIVLAANVFAMLGLRSLYFALAGVVARLRYLKRGLAVVLLLVGAKMLAAEIVHVPPLASVLAIACVLGVAAVASLATPAPRYEQAR